MQVNTNGFIEFGFDYLGRQSQEWANVLDSAAYTKASKEGFAVLAALWVDNDQSAGSSAVYYHLYDSSDAYTPSKAALTSAVMSKASQDAKTYGGYASFTPTQVLVVTWADQLPRVFYDPTKDSVS